MNQQQRIKLLAAFAAIYFIWGSTYLAIKYALETIPPFLMMGTRSLAAGAILYLWSRARGEEKLRKENVLPIVTIGILFFLVGHGLLAWAQQRIASGPAALLVASEPMWIALIEAFLVRTDRASFKTIVGLAFGLLGLGLLLAPGQKLGAHDMDLVGALVILIGTLSWSVGAVYSRIAKLPKAPALTAGLQLIVGGILLVSTGLLLGEGSRLHLDALSLRSVFGWVYLVTFGSVVAFTAYVWLLRQVSATQVATHTFVNPVIAVFLGWAVAGEPLSPQTLAATIVIVISVSLVLGKKKASNQKSLALWTRIKAAFPSRSKSIWPIPAPNPESN